MTVRHSTPTILRPLTVEGPRPVPTPNSGEAGALRSTTAPGSEPVDTTPEGRRERHRRETFERLVRAARQIMFSRGFNDITVQDITDAADVGKGTFFNYFRSKEHVVSRVHEYNRRSVMYTVDRVKNEGLPVADALTEILMGLLCPVGGEWLTYQANTMRALALNTEVRQLVSQELDKTRQSHELLMTLGQEHGEIRTDISPADLAMVQQTYMAGLTVLFWIHNTTPTPELVVDVTRKFSDLLAPPSRPAAKVRAARAPQKARGTVARKARAKRSIRRPATSKRR
jgi:AcrR family transcriptional regulator